MILGTPVVPPESWKAATCHGSGATAASRSRISSASRSTSSASRPTAPAPGAPRVETTNSSESTSSRMRAANPWKSNFGASDSIRCARAPAKRAR